MASTSVRVYLLRSWQHHKKYISVLFVSVFPCNTRISCGTSLLLNVRETRRGNREWIIQRHRKHWEKSTERRQTKHKKTITTKHTTQKTKKMNNIEHPALTEHCRIWNITPSPSKLSVIFGVTDDTVWQHSLVCIHDGIC